MVIIYGLANCDTCKKARNWLTRFEVEHLFVDYRAQPIDADTLTVWSQQLGGWDKLINRASTTWRSLLPDRKNPQTDAEWRLLLKEYPQLIKRPVTLTADGDVSVGFSDNQYKKRFGK